MPGHHTLIQRYFSECAANKKLIDSLPHGIFWSAAFLGVYSYFFYPLLLMLMPSRKASAAGASAETTQWPGLSVIVAAHNEAARIRDKLENLLALPAYGGQLEILVASDASTDRTDVIVAEYAERGVRLVRNPEREGKEAAQAMAIHRARGEIIVFSDVATSMQGDVLQNIARHFADPGVGAVSSKDEFVARDGRPSGEGAYVRYEMLLRREETRVSSLVGLSGSFFAARADVCRSQWSTDVPSDFMTAVNCVRLGYVAVSADDVVGYYSDLVASDNEYPRKVRTVLRGMHALAKTAGILNPLRYGFFAFQMWSHKLMRWLAPWFLAVLLPLNLLLLDQHAVYVMLLFAQVCFYALVLLGMGIESLRSFAIVRIPFYFVLVNVAVVHAALQFCRGRTAVTWTPSER